MKTWTPLYKSLRNMRIGLALLLFGFIPLLMQNTAAASSFSYAGVVFNSVSGADFIANNPSFVPSGMFTTINDLAPNFSGSLIGNLSSILFSDGAIMGKVITYSNPLSSSLGNVSQFNVTLLNGNITSWLILLNDTSANALQIASSDKSGVTQAALHSMNSQAFSSASSVGQGTWSTIITTPAPEFSSTLGSLLSVVLLGGMLIRSRSKALEA